VTRNICPCHSPSKGYYLVLAVGSPVGKESMELSHEPIPQRDGGTEVAMRWPPDHARVDEFRNLNYASSNYGTGLTG
jgi:hypothetical protein